MGIETETLQDILRLCSHCFARPLCLSLYCLARQIYEAVPKFGFFIQEGINKKNSYERRDYESVDEKSLP